MARAAQGLTKDVVYTKPVAMVEVTGILLGYFEFFGPDVQSDERAERSESKYEVKHRQIKVDVSSDKGL